MRYDSFTQTYVPRTSISHARTRHIEGMMAEHDRLPRPWRDLSNLDGTRLVEKRFKAGVSIATMTKFLTTRGILP